MAKKKDQMPAFIRHTDWIMGKGFKGVPFVLWVPMGLLLLIPLLLLVVAIVGMATPSEPTQLDRIEAGIEQLLGGRR